MGDGRVYIWRRARPGRGEVPYVFWTLPVLVENTRALTHGFGVRPDEEEGDEHRDVGRGGAGLETGKDEGECEGGKVDVSRPGPIGGVVSKKDIVHSRLYA